MQRCRCLRPWLAREPPLLGTEAAPEEVPAGRAVTAGLVPGAGRKACISQCIGLWFLDIYMGLHLRHPYGARCLKEHHSRIAFRDPKAPFTSDPFRLPEFSQPEPSSRCLRRTRPGPSAGAGLASCYRAQMSFDQVQLMTSYHTIPGYLFSDDHEQLSARNRCQLTELQHSFAHLICAPWDPFVIARIALKCWLVQITRWRREQRMHKSGTMQGVLMFIAMLAGVLTPQRIDGTIQLKDIAA